MVDCIIVDAAAGNWNEFDISNYKANLEPTESGNKGGENINKWR